MGIFTLSVTVVVPLVLFCLVGYMTRKWGWLSLDAYKQLNKLVFRILLPCSLFYSTFHSDFHQGLPLKYGSFALIGVVALFIVSFAIIACTHFPREKKGVIIQGIARSNYVLLGFPVIQSVYGSHIGATAALVSVVVPLFNLLSVIVLEFYSDQKVNDRHMIADIVRNPLIIGSVLGIIFSIGKLPVPAILNRTLSMMNGATTPIALIALGGTFQIKAVKGNLAILSAVIFSRLFLVPAVFLGLAAYFGFRGIEFMSLFIAFGSPTAVSSDSMAQEMGGDAELAGQIVFLTTLFSIVSFFFWITLFQAYGLI